MLEYDPGKMVCTTQDNRMLLFHDYNIVRTYDGPCVAVGSHKKGAHLECLPGCDTDGGEILFIVWSLEDAVYLVNLETTNIIQLVKRTLATYDTCGQKPFFFRREPHGESIYFTGKGEIEHEKVHQNCFKMQLGQDFFDSLLKHGRLPKLQSKETFPQQQSRDMLQLLQPKQRSSNTSVAEL